MKKSYHRGWDYFTPDPGTVERMDCAVCGEQMQVSRDCTGPTSFVEAIGSGSHPHDTFTCANYDQDWHVQIIKLEKFKQALPSMTLRDLVEREIMVIRRDRQPTIRE